MKAFSWKRGFGLLARGGGLVIENSVLGGEQTRDFLSYLGGGGGGFNFGKTK